MLPNQFAMLTQQFTLPAADDEARRMTAGWLFLGLAALVIGGLFTILIVLSRTPFFQEIIPWVDFFRTALVVHVDLTVLPALRLGRPAAGQCRHIHHNDLAFYR